MIICFSGTGNSLSVALHLSRLLDDRDIVNLRGELLVTENPEIALPCDRVVWVFPTYSWGVPPIVEKFICRVKIASDKALHFMVTTCGDDVGRIDKQWRSLVKKRGWNARGCWSVQMPNTYVCMKGFDVDPDDVAAKKLEAMPRRVEEVARQILSGADVVDVVSGSWSLIKSSLIYRWFRRYAMSPKLFRALETCTGCGACERGCPTCNIVLEENIRRPKWGGNCAFCLKCYHHCPVKAIAYGKSTNGKGQYTCPTDATVQN